MYQVLIVDDEFLARKLLQDYVSKIPELQLAGTAQNAFEAFSFCKEHHVDIVLLDIHMPDLNGIELARTLKNVPSIIFTTAYSEYALESYEVSAVDYLLKPIALHRFMQAIEKAIARLKGLAPSEAPEVSTSPAPLTLLPEGQGRLQALQDQLRRPLLCRGAARICVILHQGQAYHRALQSQGTRGPVAPREVRPRPQELHRLHRSYL